MGASSPRRFPSNRLRPALVAFESIWVQFEEAYISDASLKLALLGGGGVVEGRNGVASGFCDACPPKLERVPKIDVKSCFI